MSLDRGKSATPMPEHLGEMMVNQDQRVDKAVATATAATMQTQPPALLVLWSSAVGKSAAPLPTHVMTRT